MTQTHQLQIRLSHPPGAVFELLTQTAGLEGWFCEHAEDAGEQMLFWGRFTPLVLDRPVHGRRIHALEASKRLHFDWEMPGGVSQVDIRLLSEGGGTRLFLDHGGVPDGFPFWMEDFWFLSLENLRLHLDGRTVDRFDFSAIHPGPYSHTLEVEAPPRTVWRGLTEPQALERWIASRAEVDLKVNGVME